MTATSAHPPYLDLHNDLLVVVRDTTRSGPGMTTSRAFYDELLLAVGRHERSDPRSRGIWHEVLACVRLTSLALQLEADTEDPGAQAVTVAYALSAGRRGSVALRRRMQRDRRPNRALGTRDYVRPGLPVERTSLRLTGLLLGASPADLELLDAALANHNEALAEWRATLAHQLHVSRVV
jgi:hypothetical protein